MSNDQTQLVQYSYKVVHWFSFVMFRVFLCLFMLWLVSYARPGGVSKPLKKQIGEGRIGEESSTTRRTLRIGEAKG